jgi:hypothetical protein
MDAQQRTPVELARKGVDPDIQKLVHPDVWSFGYCHTKLSGGWTKICGSFMKFFFWVGGIFAEFLWKQFSLPWCQGRFFCDIKRNIFTAQRWYPHLKRSQSRSSDCQDCFKHYPLTILFKGGRTWTVTQEIEGEISPDFQKKRKKKKNFLKKKYLGKFRKIESGLTERTLDKTKVCFAVCRVQSKPGSPAARKRCPS